MMTSAPASNGGGQNRGRSSTSSAAASPARTSATLDDVRESTGNGPASGRGCGTPFASYDPATHCWRTFQPSLFEDLTSSPPTGPRSGMTCNGTAYLLPPSAPRTAATDGSAWPTPTARDHKDTGDLSRVPENGLLPRVVQRREQWPTPRSTDADKGGRGDLLATVRTGLPSGRKHWPTPTAADGMGGPGSSGREGGDNLRTAVGGQLNPTWVEWLMGFPPGWTALEPSATR